MRRVKTLVLQQFYGGILSVCVRCHACAFVDRTRDNAGMLARTRARVCVCGCVCVYTCTLYKNLL